MSVPDRPTPALDRRQLLALGMAGWTGTAAARSRSRSEGGDPRAGRLSLTLVSDPEPPFVLPEGHPLGEGIDIDIAREALRLGGGYQLEVQRMPWNRALNLLERGEVDLCPGLSVTPERREFLAFSESYGKPVRQEIVTRRDAGIQLTQLSELAPLRLGLVKGYAYPAKLSAQFGPRVEFGLSLAAVLRMLAAGHVDAVLTDEVSARWLLRELGFERVLRRQTLGIDGGEVSHMGFSMRRPGFQDALAAMNRGLQLLSRAPGWARFEAPYLT